MLDQTAAESKALNRESSIQAQNRINIEADYQTVIRAQRDEIARIERDAQNLGVFNPARVKSAPINEITEKLYAYWQSSLPNEGYALELAVNDFEDRWGEIEEGSQLEEIILAAIQFGIQSVSP